MLLNIYPNTETNGAHIWNTVTLSSLQTLNGYPTHKVMLAGK